MYACNTHVYVCTYEMSTTLQALNENPSEGKGLPRLSSQPTWLPMFIEATSRLPHACSVVDVQVAGLPLVYVNQAWEALTGYARAEVLGHNCRLLQGAETEEAAVAELVRSIRQRRPCVVTLTNYRKDGGRFANELSLHPVFDSRGVYRYIVGVSSDTSVVEAVIDPFAILIGTAREETGARMYPVPCTPPLARRRVRRGLITFPTYTYTYTYTGAKRPSITSLIWVKSPA